MVTRPRPIAAARKTEDGSGKFTSRDLAISEPRSASLFTSLATSPGYQIAPLRPTSCLPGGVPPMEYCSGQGMPSPGLSEKTSAIGKQHAPPNHLVTPYLL